jgi:hypothetical protein
VNEDLPDYFTRIGRKLSDRKRKYNTLLKEYKTVKEKLASKKESCSQDASPSLVKRCSNQHCTAYLYWNKNTENWSTTCAICGLSYHPIRPQCSVCESTASILPDTKYDGNYTESLYCGMCCNPTATLTWRQLCQDEKTEEKCVAQKPHSSTTIKVQPERTHKYNLRSSRKRKRGID